jgi:hypothetical protein
MRWKVRENLLNHFYMSVYSKSFHKLPHPLSSDAILTQPVMRKSEEISGKSKRAER